MRASRRPARRSQRQTTQKKKKKKKKQQHEHLGINRVGLDSNDLLPTGSATGGVENAFDLDTRYEETFGKVRSRRPSGHQPGVFWLA